MKNTLQLVFVAELLAVLIAVVIGVFSALRQYSVFDYSATTFSFLGLAMPVFWLALMLQVLVVQRLRVDRSPALPDLEPELHRSGNRGRFLDRPRSPSRAARHRPHGREHRDVLALHARLDARGRQLRLRAHRARERARREAGDDEARVPQRSHPLVTLVALNFGALLGGVIVTETVFSLDGMGLYFVTNLLTNDPYPVMAWLMVTARHDHHLQSHRRHHVRLPRPARPL